MRTEYIETKVRPIKKLFIIEPNDYESFSKLFIEIQDEIDIIQNLIFVNDSDLWSQPNKDFIKRSDPDIIINLTKLDDDKLSMHFNILSFKPASNHFKIGIFGTNINSFSRYPSIFQKFDNGKDEIQKVLCASKLENTDKSLLTCINYGIFPKEKKGHLKFTIFKNIAPTYLTKKQNIINKIFMNDDKYIHLTTIIGGFGGSGHGSSIYEVDYNREGLFHTKNRYFFISEKNDFKTISYFWNTRSYYTYSSIAWIPVNLLNDIESLVNDKAVFVCFDKNIQKRIKDKYPSNEIIHPQRLHFRGRNERWVFFEHNQTISITNNETIIQHPVEKSFSDMGSAGAFVLETRGLKEFAFPKRRNIGNLFFPKNYDNKLTSERFLRISERGISKYVLEFSPLQANDITQLIYIPSFNQVIEHIFNDVGYDIKKTAKTSILDQTINLSGGLDELNIICNKNIFDLLISLTPKVRTEKVVKKLLKDVQPNITSENILEIIAEIREKGGVNFPSVTLTIKEIINKASLKENDQKMLFPVLQKLYDHRILLRGKYFQCPFCNSNLWIQIDEINQSNYCIECSNEINLPVYVNNKQGSDHFRLNQLIVRAVDQGQLSTLLLLNLFFLQKYRVFNYMSNLEVFKDGKLITDIDLLINIGKKIGICECKSTSGFSKKQVDELINIATILKCDFIAFSNLNDSKSPEVLELFSILNKKTLNIPAFILTSNALFNPNSNMIQEKFELNRSENFKVGPIIIN